MVDRAGRGPDILPRAVKNPRETILDRDRLVGLARSWDLELSTRSIAGISEFTTLFLRWNSSINLGAVASADELLGRHIVDALVAARFVSGGSRVIDVGSGGGLPALPLALVREEAQFTLFEPTAKKAAFLRAAIRELGIGDRVQIRTQRVQEPLPPELRGRFEVAVSRAVLAPALWLNLGRKLVAAGGRVLVYGTERNTEELGTPLEATSYGDRKRLMVFGRAASTDTPA